MLLKLKERNCLLANRGSSPLIATQLIDWSTRILCHQASKNFQRQVINRLTSEKFVTAKVYSRDFDERLRRVPQQDKKTTRQQDNKTRRQEDKKTRRQEDKKTTRQQDKKTTRQQDKKTTRQIPSHPLTLFSSPCDVVSAMFHQVSAIQSEASSPNNSFRHEASHLLSNKMWTLENLKYFHTFLHTILTIITK